MNCVAVCRDVSLAVGATDWKMDSSFSIASTWGRTRKSAAMHSGSNWLPAPRRSSSNAASAGIPLRYGRSEVMASNASATATTRAASGISSP